MATEKTTPNGTPPPTPNVTEMYDADEITRIQEAWGGPSSRTPDAIRIHNPPTPDDLALADRREEAVREVLEAHEAVTSIRGLRRILTPAGRRQRAQKTYDVVQYVHRRITNPHESYDKEEKVGWTGVHAPELKGKRDPKTGKRSFGKTATVDVRYDTEPSIVVPNRWRPATRHEKRITKRLTNLRERRNILRIKSGSAYDHYDFDNHPLLPHGGADNRLVNRRHRLAQRQARRAHRLDQKMEDIVYNTKFKVDAHNAKIANKAHMARVKAHAKTHPTPKSIYWVRDESSTRKAKRYGKRGDRAVNNANGIDEQIGRLRRGELPIRTRLFNKLTRKAPEQIRDQIFQKISDKTAKQVELREKAKKRYEKQDDFRYRRVPIDVSGWMSDKPASVTTATRSTSSPASPPPTTLVPKGTLFPGMADGAEPYKPAEPEGRPSLKFQHETALRQIDDLPVPDDTKNKFREALDDDVIAELQQDIRDEVPHAHGERKAELLHAMEDGTLKYDGGPKRIVQKLNPRSGELQWRLSSGEAISVVRELVDEAVSDTLGITLDEVQDPDDTMKPIVNYLRARISYRLFSTD